MDQARFNQARLRSLLDQISVIFLFRLTVHPNRNNLGVLAPARKRHNTRWQFGHFGQPLDGSTQPLDGKPIQLAPPT